MSPTDPRRTHDQAEVFRDPWDRSSNQRNWPIRNQSVSCYNDVGTSYHFNMNWHQQLDSQGNSFTNAWNIGAARLASGQNVTPSRMAIVMDQYADIAHYTTSTMIVTDSDAINRSSMLYYDGHAAYNTLLPRTLSTPQYTVLFD
jgi:hypothetical protein